MPYIDQPARQRIDAGGEPTTAGELNYSITQLVHGYLRRHGRKYQVFNEIIGALEAAKLELYRRHVAPYEDQKIAENGDVP